MTPLVWAMVAAQVFAVFVLPIGYLYLWQRERKPRASVHSSVEGGDR